MEISEILQKIGIEHTCNRKGLIFHSLGLIEYYMGDSVCTFVENEKYIKEITSDISIVLTTGGLAEKLEKLLPSVGICVVEKPRETYFLIHNFLSSADLYEKNKIPTKIGENCNISEHAIIPKHNVVIGNNVTIEEFVVLRENTEIGNDCIIRSGCIIGGEGFEFKKSGDNVFGVKHVGGVVIGNHVEIQYNSCIDKAIYPWDKTVIEDYVKVDNLVHIAHGVKVGKRSMIVANSGIGGRVIVGKDVWIGFGATIRNGINIKDNARVNMGAVVTKKIEKFEKVSGNFAIPHETFIEKMKKLNGGV